MRDWFDDYLDGMNNYKIVNALPDSHIGKKKPEPNILQKKMLFDAAAISEAEMRLIKEARVALESQGGDDSGSSATKEGPLTPAVTVPGAPTLTSLSAGNATLSAYFTAPASNGGSVITNYAYSTGGSFVPRSPAATTSPLIITGLSNGTLYGVSLGAINAVGQGTASNTLSATPTAPAEAVLVLDLNAESYSGSGNWLDGSGNNNNATPVATPTYTASNGAYFDFDGGTTTGPGVRDSFNVGDSATLDTMNGISFEMWINIDSIQGVGAANLLFCKRLTSSDGYVGFVSSAGYTFRAGTAGASNINYAVSPSTSSWQHLVVTIGSGGSKIYINNNTVADTAYTGNFSNINTNAGLSIADLSIAAVGTYALDGKIGLFRIYNGTLSTAQVSQRWNDTKSRFGL